MDRDDASIIREKLPHINSSSLINMWALQTELRVEILWVEFPVNLETIRSYSGDSERTPKHSVPLYTETGPKHCLPFWKLNQSSQFYCSGNNYLGTMHPLSNTFSLCVYLFL